MSESARSKFESDIADCASKHEYLPLIHAVEEDNNMKRNRNSSHPTYKRFHTSLYIFVNILFGAVQTLPKSPKKGASLVR